MTVDDLKETWDVRVGIDKVQRTQAGQIIDLAMRVGQIVVTIRKEVIDGQNFSPDDLLYSMAFDLSYLSDPNLTYPQFCQATGLNSRLKKTLDEYKVLGRYFTTLQEELPAKFLQDLKCIQK